MNNSDTREITREIFIGRKTELDIIEKAIDAPGFQIISIQGEGGIGKTSLLKMPQNRLPVILKTRCRLKISGKLSNAWHC